MKHRLLTYFLAAAFVLTGCDVIPDQEQSIEMEPVAARSRALLTEFTGFLCVNCPMAAEEAHNLLDVYADNLVVVEMHPASNAFCQTTIAAYDYTCPEADVYYKALGGTSSTAFPTGVINFSSGLTDYTTWSTWLARSVQKESLGRIDLRAAWSGSDRHIDVHYHVDAFSPNMALTGESKDLSAIVWLVEDSIVGPQMMPNGSTNMSYVHNHVLRAALTSDWGEPIATKINVSSNEMKTISYSVPDSINGQAIQAEHCSVVGVLVDTDTGVVLDATKVDL